MREGRICPKDFLSKQTLKSYSKTFHRSSNVAMSFHFSGNDFTVIFTSFVFFIILINFWELLVVLNFCYVFENARYPSQSGFKMAAVW